MMCVCERDLKFTHLCYRHYLPDFQKTQYNVRFLGSDSNPDEHLSFGTYILEDYYFM
jgi:hypothetical protein